MKNQILPKTAHNGTNGITISTMGVRIGKELVGGREYARVFTLPDDKKIEIQLHKKKQSDLFKLKEENASFVIKSRSLYRNLKERLPGTKTGPKTYTILDQSKDQITYLLDL